MSISWHVLDDGRPGHTNQSWGLIQHFDPQLENTSSSRLSEPRSWLKRPVLLLLFFASSRSPLLSLLYKLYYRRQPPTHPQADLLISTGGDTLIANIILSRLWQIPNIFLGKESRLTTGSVALLVTIAAGKQLPNVLRLPLAPMRRAVVEPDHQSPSLIPLIAVLVGGDSQEYQYEKADYEALADSLNNLCEQQGWQLLLTTSRRTGTLGETILRSRLAACHLAEATWYAEQPNPTAGVYSTRASMILCSEDSGSMLTESLLYGKPVVAFYPHKRHPNRPHQNLLDRMTKYGVITSTIPALATLRLNSLKPTQTLDYRILAKSVLPLLEKS